MAIFANYSVQNFAGIASDTIDEILNLMDFGFELWGELLAGSAFPNIDVQILEATPAVTADAGPSDVLFIGNPNGKNTFEGTFAYELRHNSNPNGNNIDATIRFDVDYLLNELWFDSTPSTANDIPVDKIDALSVIVHEIGHMLGFTGYYLEGSNSFIDDARSPYDQRLLFINNDVLFTGPNTLESFGNPVPLTDNNYAHYGNVIEHPSSGNPLAGLMNGVAFFRGTRYEIADLDLSFLADLGLGTDRDDIFDQTWLDVIRGGEGVDKFIGDYSDSRSNLTIDAQGSVFLLPNLQLHEIEALELTLGSGNDLVIGSAGVDIIIGNDGDDILDGGSAGQDLIFGGEGQDTLTGGSGGDLLNGGADNDSLDGNGGKDRLFGEGGSDSINGGGDRDEIFGGDGADYLIGGDSADRIFGGAGDDTISGRRGSDFIDAGSGDDFVSGRGLTDTIFGGDGNDELRGNGGRDTIHGDAGNDLIVGGQGDDTLFGGVDDDVLDGRAGNDILSGGSGSDTLTGKVGSDTFVFEAGHEQVEVTDFKDDVDTLDLSSYGFSNVSEATALMSEVDGDVLFVSGGDTLTLRNITIVALQDDIAI
ncbi:hypothetical protein [Parvularcula sp. IMCC14364]|uniref:hypothetical protein n=1 Tax=Parvularcula sp. IMCC14364 TaxID=3067902 RepID=UPI0027405EB8|nr:hypothetical protein [Parvularcula sp. IMCC14364]